MAPRTDIAAIASDPAWFPHRYDESADAIHFLRLEREGHRRLTFITDEYLPSDLPKLVLRRAEVAEGLQPRAPIHFIFHSAYCCSTLLARALDIEGIATSLKEPMILNDMVGWQRRGAESRQISSMMDTVLTLLAQPFAPDEAVLVKPSNLLNAYAPGILGLRPDARALLLHAPLADFLRSIARKGLWGRWWVRELFMVLLDLEVVDLGLDQKRYLDLTDLQIAAAGWLAQHAMFHRVFELYPDRVRSLDSEVFLSRPEEALSALAGLFGLSLDAAAVAAGPGFKRHSKFDSSFSPEDRAADQRDAATLHADEIDKVAVWAEAVAANAGISMTLPAPLLGRTPASPLDRRRNLEQ